MNVEIYVRNDHQCLFAYADGQSYQVDRDPYLRETYLSISLNGNMVYFKDLVSDRSLVEDPIGMAAYQSHVERVRLMDKELERDNKCQVPVDFIYLLYDNFDDLCDYSQLPMYIKGEHLLNILTSAGYVDPEDWFDFKLDRGRMYFIHSDYIHDDIVNLIPDCVVDIVADSQSPARFELIGALN